jgi:hypothetical protein
MLVAALVLASACDRSRETGKHDGPAAVVAVADAAPLDAGVTALDASPGAALPAPEAAGGEALVVTTATPRPGTSATVTYDAKLDYDLNLGGFKNVTATTQSKKKRVEIVAVDPDGTVHKRITYVKRDTSIVVDGERKKDPSPIRGKTYLVTWKDGELEVLLRNGNPASNEETEAVRREEALLQSPDFLGKALVGVRLVEGQPFEVPLVMLEKIVRGEYRPRRMVLTYRGKTKDGSRIDAEGSVATEGRGMKTFFDVKAEIVLDTTGWCRSFKATGQIRAELNGAVVGSGAGTGIALATALR